MSRLTAIFNRYGWSAPRAGYELTMLQEMRAELLKRMQTKIDNVESGAISKTPSVTAELDQISNDIERIDEELEPLQAEENRKMKKASQIMAAKSDPEEDFATNKMFHIRKSVPVKKDSPVSDFVLRNYNVSEVEQKIDVWSVLCSLMGKNYGENSRVPEVAEAYRSALTGTALLNPFLSAQLIDGALSRSHLYNSGMNVFAAQAGEHKFARVVTFPTLEWKAALAQTTERTTTFDSVTFDAKTLRGWIEIGGELLQDAMNLERQLRRVFTQATANQIDTAGLYGAGGSDEPLGIRNYVGIPTYEHDAALTSYDPFIQAQKLVWDEDGPDLDTSIMAPSSLAQLYALKAATELTPIPPPWFLANHRFLQTSKAPQDEDNNDESSIIMGGFQSLNLGIRLQVQIMISPVIAETYSYKLLCVFRGDFQPDRVEDLAIITGVTQGDFT